MSSPGLTARLLAVSPSRPFVVKVKLTSRDPSPPPLEYVRGGGGIFKDMAVHDLDMSRFLMGSEPTVCLILGQGGGGRLG